MAIVKPQVTLRLEEEFRIKLKIISQEENRSMASMLRFLLQKEIERYEAENGKIEITDEDYGLL